MDAGLIAAYSDPILSEVLLVKIVWPTGTMRLCTTSGEVVYSSETYRAVDDVWGQIISAESVADGMSNIAPTCSFIFSNTTALDEAVKHASFQKSRVDIWRGLRSLETGTIVGMEPLLLAGWVSNAKLKFTKNARVIEVLCVGHQEARFIAQGGINYDTNFDKQIDASDKFNEFGAGSSVISPSYSIGTNYGTGAYNGKGYFGIDVQSA